MCSHYLFYYVSVSYPGHNIGAVGIWPGCEANYMPAAELELFDYVADLLASVHILVWSLH